MGKTLKLLVVDGNTSALNDLVEEAGGMRFGEGYSHVLETLEPNARTTVVRPADDGSDCLPEGASLLDFDGIVLTGSGLNAYSDAPEVTEQLVLARRAYASGVPVFGSCWGLQVMCLALGGVVRLNPQGREVPIARTILPNEAGRSHPMLKGRPDSFDAVAIHMDEVSELPEGACLLASNGLSDVQAVEITDGTCRFWGVQYHPEFSLEDIAALLRRSQQALVSEGVVESDDTLQQMAKDFQAIESQPNHPAADKWDLNADVTGIEGRTLEIRNWLETLKPKG